MDLSLRGSQINLSTRFKPKPPTVKYPVLQRPGSANCCNRIQRISPNLKRRPLSADQRILNRRIHENSGRFNGRSFFDEGKLHRNKRFLGVSSSNLLKLLLDEPIKKSWLSRDPDEQSDISLGEKISNVASSYQRKESNENAAKENSLNSSNLASPETASGEDLGDSILLANSKRNPNLQYSCNFENFSNTEKNLPTFEGNHIFPKETLNSVMFSSISSNQQTKTNGDFWHDTKPDLPGRVSFNKSHKLSNDFDLSDNDEEINFLSGDDNLNISKTAPAAAKPPPYPITTLSSALTTSTTTTAGNPSAPALTTTTSTSNKKTVHFGDSVDTAPPVYEYPRCPSENCSCDESKQSLDSTNPVALSNESKPYSSSGDTNNNNRNTIGMSSPPKCICEFSCNTSNEYTNLNISSCNRSTIGSTSTTPSKTAYQSDELDAIKQYKNQLDDESKKIQLEIKLTEQKLDEKEKIMNTINNRFPNITSKGIYSANIDIGDKFQLDYNEIHMTADNFSGNTLDAFSENHLNGNAHQHQQNNYIDLQNLNSIGGNNSLLTMKLDNIHFNKDLINSSTTERTSTSAGTLTAGQITSSSSDNTASVIKNFLEVSRTKIVPGKKQNNNCYNNRDPGIIMNGSSTIRKKTKSITTNNNSNNNRRSKSASSEQHFKTNKGKLQKSASTAFREDSNLDEFHLDKVDSWMSLHSGNNNYDELHHHHHNRNKENEKKFRTGPKYYPDQYEDTTTTDELLDSEEISKSDGCSQDSSTYDEIVSVIKEIEEDKKKGIHHHDPNINVDLKLQSLLQETPSDESTQKNSTPESPDKLKEILNYLEDVENSCEKTLLETRRSLPDSSNRSEIEFAMEPDITEDVPKLSDLLMLPNHQLARRVIALTLRANELANGVHLSKEHISKIRQEKLKAVRLEKQNNNSKIREQKKHYESVVARHQGFIEQLLKDKASLCEKVTALTRRLDSQNQAWEHKLETELSRVKETAVAGEKIRRERWVRENTKKIKELTVKGLEAEINRMVSDHQQEINELKRHHQQELLDAVDEARLKHEEMEKSIRESCTQDRENIIEKERTAIRERFERQLQDEQRAFDEHKNKLIEEFSAERERWQAEMKQKEIEWQNKMQDLFREKEASVERVYTECREKLEQQESKYQNRISSIEKQFESDFLIWKREFENACKLREVENENAIRQHYRTERDRQIDAIVTKMDNESQKTQEEHEIKLNRLKEKYDNDIKEAESMEKSLRDKYNETRSRLAESDAQVQNLQAEMKQMQIELEHSKRMCEEFLVEKEQLKENARNEVQAEISTIKTERDNEIQRIHKRVQQAIEKKDTTIEFMQKENTNLRERCIKLETIIRQQRKDYCIK